MCKKLIVLALVLGFMASMAQANLVVTNGTFDGGEPADTDVPDWYDLDTTPAGNTDWWATASISGGPNPFPDGSAFMGDHLWGGTAGGNRWMYQQIGTKEEGVNYQISFEYAQPTDGSEDRSVAIQVDIYQGIFDGAAQDVDIADQGLTLIDSLTSPYESEMIIHSFTSALDLSLANTTDPLWLRISNLGEDTGAFVAIDNVQITSESAEPPEPMHMEEATDFAKAIKGRMIPPLKATASITSGTPCPRASLARPKVMGATKSPPIIGIKGIRNSGCSVTCEKRSMP